MQKHITDDIEINEVLNSELKRQQEKLELIASENFVVTGST
jgi:glycine/serine hydroxymethyltransferase